LVTLTGVVGSYAHKVAAQEAAHRVHGVRDVVNDLVVVLPPVGGRTDTEIARAVRVALEWNTLVPGEQITTTVANGWVTLEGTVGVWQQRQDAEQAVDRVAGVQGVLNRIIVDTPALDSAEVRDAIEEALERQAVRTAERIEVGVVGGTVVLSGRVRSWAEKRAVLGAAGHAPGVSRVEDHIQVDPQPRLYPS
jgi:osmotically-inducible protein OsmY